MNPTTTALRGGTLDLTGLSARVRSRIAAVLIEEDQGQAPVMLDMPQAAKALAPGLGRKPGGLVSAWRDGTYPCPDLFAGCEDRERRLLRVPAVWVEAGLQRGGRGIVTKVTERAMLKALRGWPDHMTISQVATAMSVHWATARRLLDMDTGLETTSTSGVIRISKASLTRFLVTRINQAVDEWAGEAS